MADVDEDLQNLLGRFDELEEKLVAVEVQAKKLQELIDESRRS